jgi:hypothetical protein
MSANAATPAEPPPATPEQGERTYLFLCLVALLLMLAVLLERGERERALFPVLIGLAGLVLRWRITPLLLVGTLAAALFYNAYWRGHLRHQAELRSLATTLSDLALCIAVLAFLAGFYRLQGLTVAIFPRDPRRRSAAGGPALNRTRPELLVTAAELALLLGMLPFWAGLAHFLYPELIGGARVLDRNPAEGLGNGWEAVAGVVAVTLRSRRLILGLGGVALVASTVIGYLAWRRMSAAEAELALQDVAWEETRAEQRRIARWSAWGNIRASRREDGR